MTKKRTYPLGEPQEHIALVKDIFSSIPKRYDLLNHLFSFGQDWHWRRFTVRKMKIRHTGRFLDLACGTADLAVAAARRYPELAVVGVDLIPEMLTLGQVKIARLGLANQIKLLRGDATRLPFPDNSFDTAAIAFGIRNIPDRLQALEEMTRVVVPGGRVMVLEMGFPQKRLWRILFYPYLNLILPLLSRLLSKNPAAYRYLADSIMSFPAPQEFCRLMAEAGLAEVEFYPLTMGITSLYLGEKRAAAGEFTGRTGIVLPEGVRGDAAGNSSCPPGRG